MTDKNEPVALESKGMMPRREFIRKSLTASGGVFVGMSVLGKMSTPQLTAAKSPVQSASGDKDKVKDKSKNKNSNQGGGRFGGNRG